MEIWAIVVGVGVIVGIIAGVVQVLDYLQKRREEPDDASKETQPSAPAAVPQTPHNLPPRGEFVGREIEKARVHEALRSRSYLVSIDGIGGIGKTALALEVAYECLRASQGKGATDGVAAFDGFIWTTAKDRDLSLNALFDAIARTLDYPGIVEQPLDEKQIAVQKLLREKSYLLMVDNFETITDDGVHDFLLKLPEPSKALITTREQKLQRVWAISLKGLAEEEALALVRGEGRRLSMASLELAEEQVLLHLYQATGGAPLAIKWAVGQIKQKGQSLDTVLADLYGATGDIFDHIFARSWGLLSDDARQVLTVMPVFATTASWAGIESASDVHHFALNQALGQIIEMSLVDATDELDIARRRYSIHPLTRAFAATRVQPGLQHQAYERLLAYYKQLVMPPEERTGDLYWDGLANVAQAGDLEPEWENMEHLIRWALDQGYDEAALDLFLPLVHLLNVWGLWDNRLRLSRDLCQAAHRLGDPVEAWLWIDAIGHILRKRQQFLELMQVLETGKALACEFDLEDASILADVFQADVEMDDIDRAQARIDRALEQVGLDTVMEHGTPVRRIVAVRAFYAAASLCRLKQDFVGAKEWHERELELRRLTGDYPVPILSILARTSLQLNEVASAEEYLDEASANAGKKDWPWINYSRALVAEKKGEWQVSRGLGVRALEQFTRLGQKTGVQACQELLARLPSPPESTEREDEKSNW